MAKHIHIHLHRGKTGDAGNFDESKHKRDDDGKFSSGGGGGKGPQTQAGKREAQRREAFRAKADEDAKQGVAKFDLASLKHVLQRPHQQLTVGRYGSTTPERGSKPSRAASNLGGFGSGGKGTPPVGAKAAASSSGAPNWSASNGNWDKAKKEGRELVQAKLQEAKTGGDRTDALLALKKQAEVEHKKGSYLAAVVIGEVNDYFDRVK